MIGRELSLAVIAGLIALFALPLVIDNDYIMALGISFAAMSVLAGGLNLIYGYTGLLSFAQVGFFGIGGYTATLLVVDRGWSLWAGVAVGGVGCCAQPALAAIKTAMPAAAPGWTQPSAFRARRKQTVLSSSPHTALRRRRSRMPSPPRPPRVAHPASPAVFAPILRSRGAWRPRSVLPAVLHRANSAPTASGRCSWCYPLGRTDKPRRESAAGCSHPRAPGRQPLTRVNCATSV